jgi:anti-anti-sigma factor
VVLNLYGELDFAEAPRLQHELDRLAMLGREVVIRLHELTFVDSAGMRVLSGRDGVPGPRLVGARPHVRRFFALIGKEAMLVDASALDEVGAITTSRSSALA